MKRNQPVPARHVDPILQELYAVKAVLNRKAKYDVKILGEQVRKEGRKRGRTNQRAA